MRHIPGEGAGKGDVPRPVDKAKYDESWIRCFGKVCISCGGTGKTVCQSGTEILLEGKCLFCNGIGKVEK